MRLNPFRRSASAVVAGSITNISPSISVSEKLDDYPLDEDPNALDVMVDMLYRTCWPLGWVPAQQVASEDWTDEVILGISIRSYNSTVQSCPEAHDGFRAFENAVSSFGVRAAVKMSSKAVEYIFANHM
jgi:hypothetical protein